MIRIWHDSDRDYTGEHENFTSNVIKWIELGYTNKELCFVWDEGTTIKGGVVFSKDGANKAQILDFSLSLDSFHLGANILEQSLEMISVQSVSYHLYNDCEQYNQYIKCFLDVGFIVIQEKLSYRFTREMAPDVNGNIKYLSLAEVGEKEFLEAIVLVTQQTLDRSDMDSVIKNGPEEAARLLFMELKELDFQPEIWMLAYVADSFIGLVIPQRFGNAIGGINYIGVAPTERGKGYVDCLLSKGTTLLMEQGIATIIADTDIKNIPMQKALERIGYDFSCEEVILLHQTS